MRIGICVDRSIDGERLRDKIGCILLQKDLDAELVVFASEEEFLCKIEEMDAVFVCIDLIADIREYRCCQSRNLIIIAVGKEEQYRKAFRISANYYVAEPFDLNDIEESIKIILKNRVGKKVLELYNNRLLYFVEERNIEYIEAYNGYVLCIMGKRIFRKESSLSQMMKELDNRIFFHISRQFVVNMMWILRYEDGMVYLKGKEISVPRRRRKLFERMYMQFGFYR